MGKPKYLRDGAVKGSKLPLYNALTEQKDATLLCMFCHIFRVPVPLEEDGVVKAK